MTDTAPSKHFSSAARSLFLAVLFLHPLLRACWDLWAQFVVYAFLCVVVILFFWHEFRSNGDIGRAAGAFFVPLAIFAAAGIYSTTESSFPHSAFRTLLPDTTCLVFFFLGLFSHRKELPTNLKTIFGSAVVVCLWALAESWPRFVPLSGPLINPNVLAGFLILLIPPAVEMVRHEIGLRRVFWTVMITGLALSTLLTRSSSGIAVVAALFVFMFSTRRPAFRWSSLALLTLVGGVWILFGGGKEKFLHDADRLVWWNTGLRIWLSSPYWGVGPGAFGEAYPGFRVTAWGQNSLYAHSWILEMLSERGVLGTGGFLIWLFLLGRRVRGKKDPFISAIRLSMAAFLIYNFLHIGFSFPSLAWTFWFLGGTLWALAEDNGNEPIRFPAWARTSFLAGPAILLLGVGLFGFKVFRADQYATRARYRMLEGDAGMAETLVQSGLKWNPHEPELYALRARLFSRQGNDMGADSDIETALRCSPTNADFHVLAGDLKLKRGQSAAAMDHFVQASRLMPLNVLPWVRQAQMYEMRELWPEALSCYQQAEEAMAKRSAIHGNSPNQTEMEKMRIVEDSVERVRGKIESAKQ